MSKSVELPQDVIDTVIAAAGDDTQLLKQCSLVSSSFLLPSRKHLFSRIVIGDDQTSQGIHRLLIQNPVIQTFVRAITLTEYMSNWSKTPEWINGTSLLAILRLPYSCLECFSIVCEDDDEGDMVFYVTEDAFPSYKPLDWNCFSSDMKDALSNIVSSSTLKTICLDGITNVPSTSFLHIAHITTLELHSLTPNYFCDENSLTPAASKGVAPMVSNTVIDRCVWRYGEQHVHWRPVDLIFLPFMSRVRFLEIYLDLGSGSTDQFKILASLMGSLSISLTSPEHLEFNIRFCAYNKLLNPNMFYENLRNACNHLDSIATSSYPTSSELQRVDIKINYVFRCEHEDGAEPDKDKVLKAVVGGLPLLCRKGILFVKAVLGNDSDVA